MSKSITQLPAKTTIADTDILPIVSGGINYKVEFSNLRSAGTLAGRVAYVDATYGSDATGQLRNQSKPYKTIAAAQTAVSALSNYTIMIMPGAYTDTDLGGTFTNYYFMPGATLTSNGNCFTDGGGNMFFKVLGYGVFSSTGTGGKAVCYLTGSISNVVFNGINSTGNDRCFWVENGARLNVEMSDYIYSKDEAALRVDTDASANSILTVKTRLIEAETVLLQTKNGQANGTIYVTADTLTLNTTGTNYSFMEQIGGSIYINANCSQSTVGTLSMFNMSAGSVYCSVKGNIYNTAAVSTLSCAAGVFDSYGKISTTGKLVINGGEVNLYNNVEGSVAASEVVSISTGTLRVMKRIVNLINNASAHGIVTTGGTIILDGATIVLSNASAKSVYASTAKNIKIYYAVSNYAMDANITNTITGTSMIVDIDVV